MKQTNKRMGLLIVLCLSISVSIAQNFHVIDVDKGMHSFPVNNFWDFYDASYSKFEYAVLNGIAYFSADDGIHGRELWRSDGTVAGTQMIKDINPGFASSEIHDITVSGNYIYFSANDGMHGAEVWVSNGTPQGTRMTKDIYRGIIGSSPSYLIDVNGILYFFINYSSTADQLWKTDGTKAGTNLVTNFYSAKFSYSSYANQLTNVNGRLFFVLNGTFYNPYPNAELWTSDGTSDGTALVKDINPFGGSSPGWLTPLNGGLYFSADDGTGRRLWVSDGTDAGTYTVNNSNNIYIDGDPFVKMTIKGNSLYFSGYSSDNDGSELCSFNTANPTANVRVVKDFVPGSPSHNLYNFINVNGTIFFTVYAGTNSDQTLWKSDGTTAGTVLVKDINPGGANIYWYKEFKNHNGTLLFSFYDDGHGTELWKSDGTETGTTIVKELFPGIYSSSFYGGFGLASTTYIGNNVSLFQANDGKGGVELWRTDGTESGTYLVKNINQSSTGSSNPWWLTSIAENKLIFSAGNFKYSNELWKTDGLSSDAKLVKDIFPGSIFGSYPFYLLNINNIIYFFASIRDTTVQNTSDVFSVLRLFRTDGTSNGTKIIQAPGLESTINYSGYIANVFATSNLYYNLVFNFSTYQYELWRTDGTEAGTFAVKTDIDGSYYPQPTPSGNILFFTNNDPTYGNELWSTDGTVTGTKMVKDINPDFNSSNPYNLYAFNGKLYFNATDANFQTYIWSSDGTGQGTKPVKKTIVADWWLGGANSKLLFASYDTYHGEELWGTDGTATGTKLIKDILPGPDGSVPGTGVSTGSVVYFTATTVSYGSELWKSDGTFAGTKLVKDIVPGTESSFLDYLVTANAKLYFINNSDNGSLWSSDGTADGTTRINDAGLTDVTGIWNLTPAGDKLYLTGFTYATGNELYVGDISKCPVASSNTDMVKTETGQNFDIIFPNPVKQLLHVRTNGSATFSLINQSGKPVLTKTILNSGIINVSNLAGGIYYLKNTQTGQMQKIIIAK